MTMKLVSFGEIIWDIYGEKKTIGGAPLNFAAHAARCGAEAYLLSAVGDDALGAEAKTVLRRFGIRSDFTLTEAGRPTGVCHVTLDENGVPTYAIAENCAYDAIPVSGFLDAAAHQKDAFDAFCFGTLALREEENRATVTKLLHSVRFREIYADLNVRMPFCSPCALLLCLEHATIVKISDEELPLVLLMLGDVLPNVENADIYAAAKALSACFPQIKLLIFTLGGKGSTIYDCRIGRFQCISAPSVKVVSTVGAGDSYGAAFLVSYLAGEPISVCLERATARSAFVVAHAEAVPEE